MSIDLNNKITDLPNYADKQYEYRLPLIICPICGDKDHIKLIDYNATVDNNLQADYFHDYTYLYSHSMSYSHEINAHCTKCGSSINFSISANVPRKEPIVRRDPR